MTEFAERYGPWAVVTGAAQGVGLAWTEAIHARGVAVVLVDRDPAVVEVAAGLPGETKAVVADLARPGWLDDLAIASDGLEVGLVVANAAASFVGRFLDQSPASIEATVTVNCLATTQLAAWALPPMVARGRGGVIIMSSGSAMAGTAAVASYSASKAYGINLAEAVGWEVRGTGVDTLAVVGPSMDTPGWRDHREAKGKVLQDAVDPRQVVEGALDHLPEGGRYLPDAGLEFLATVERRARVDLLSQTTTALYPEAYGEV